MDINIKGAFQNSSHCTFGLFSLPFVLQSALNDPWAESLCHNAELEECTSIFQHIFVFYRLLSCMHVIDLFHWPGTSSRFTSGFNYWPPSLVSLCSWCLLLCMFAQIPVKDWQLIGFFTCCRSVTLPEWNLPPNSESQCYITHCGSNSSISGFALMVKCEVISLQYGRSRRCSIMEGKQPLWLQL